MGGKLSIVATPIGNLGDITLRALDTLRAADVILCEDTRTTQKLLAYYEIHAKQLVSFFEGNEQKRQPEVINNLLVGRHVALVSESGTPLVCDPGYKLVRECIKLGIQTETLPGPAAVIGALTISGLPPNAFLFLGYLPRKDSHAQQWLQQAKQVISDTPAKTIILYESPHRLLRTLQLTEQVFGDINVVIARELTKIHEEVRREKVSESLLHFDKVKPRGEFVVLFSLD